MANNNHFKLTLDTLAPTGSITRAAEYMKENANMTITKDDSAIFMKVWFDKEAVGTKESAGYQAAEWIAADTSYKTKFNETSDGLYYHVVFMDDVANESEVYNTEAMVYDTVAPVVTDFVLFDIDSNDQTLVNDMKVGYTWVAADPAPAHIVKAIISGADIDTVEVAISDKATTATGEVTFKEGTQDGIKTLTVALVDVAGNISATAEASITLDTHLDAPVITVAKDGKAIGEWINYHDVQVTLRCSDTSVIGYKIWEGANEPDEWTTQAADALNVTVDFTLSAGDGEKVINAKVKDAALNTQEAAAVVTKIDTVDPVIDFAVDRTLMSEVEGYTEAVFTITASDDYADIKNIHIFRNGSEDIYCETEAKDNATFTITTEGMVEGANEFTLSVEDKAGNASTKSLTIVFDTTNPSDVSITKLNEWYNADFGIQVTYEDAHIGNNKGNVVAWVSEIPNDTVVAENAVVIDATVSPQQIAAANIGGNKMQSAENYMHVKVTDAVGNVSYAHHVFGFDNVAPVIESVVFEKKAYGSTASNINIRYSDGTSGVVSMQISGDLTNGHDVDEWVEAGNNYHVVLTEGDGDKTVSVKVKDAAGNVCEQAVSATCELDTTAPGITVELFENDGVTVKPNNSPLDTIAIKIAISDDDTSECQYKIYGDVTKTQGSAAGITKDDAEFVDYQVTGGKTYVMVTDHFATSGDGIKEIYVLVIDNAGNVTESNKVSFILDTVAPVVTVNTPDYSRVSKVHVLRRNDGGEIAGKFADEVTFEFTPDSFIQAYKVCAYVDQAAAEQGNPAVDAPIGNTHGSINMQATGLSSNASVTAKIKGADFEAALGDAGDGLHYVVVYVQDYAGTWSVAANFAA